MSKEREEKEHKHIEDTDRLLENQNLLPEDNSQHDHSSSINDDSILKSLLLQYNESAKRARGVLIIVSLAALLLLVGVFNNRLTWLATKEYRTIEGWPERLKAPINFENYSDSSEAFLDAMNRISENEQPKFQKYLMHEVLDGAMKTIDVPILGVQIYIEDLPILGSVGLLILLVWFYYTRRRERSIVKLLRSKAVFADPKTKKHVVENIYTAISLNQVFNDIPELDSFEKRTFLKYADKFLKYYVNILTILPVLIILCVVIIDAVETYTMPTPFKIPKVEFIIKKIEDSRQSDSTRKKMIEDETNAINDSLYLIKNVVDSLYRVDTDSIKGWHFHFMDSVNTHTNDWKKKLLIEKHLTKYTDTLGVLENKYFQEATLFDFIKYNREDVDKMMKSQHRGFKSLDDEILYLRTLLPMFLVLLNFLISWMIHKIAKSSDEHLRKIHREYLKYFNHRQFSFDTQPIAHIQVIVRQNEKPCKAIQNVKIKAVNNYREEYTNKGGIALFQYLQVLGDETFVLSHSGYNTEMCKKTIHKIEGGKPNKSLKRRLLQWLPFTGSIINKMRKQEINDQSVEINIKLRKMCR